MQKKISIALECFVKKDDTYLMLQRNKNKRILPEVWMAPGGHLEPEKGVFECAHREILEETGLKIKNFKVKAIEIGMLLDIKTDVYFYFITADYASGKLHEKPEDGQLRWLPLDDILKLDNLLSELKMVLTYVLDKTDKVVVYKAVYDHGNNMKEFILENLF